MSTPRVNGANNYVGTPRGTNIRLSRSAFKEDDIRLLDRRSGLHRLCAHGPQNQIVLTRFVLGVPNKNVLARFRQNITFCQFVRSDLVSV